LVQKSRAAMDSAGLYGSRVSIHQSEGALPYGPYFANIICSDSLLRTGILPEDAAGTYRLLRPCGGVLAFGHLAKPALLQAKLRSWLKLGGGGEELKAAGRLWVHTRKTLPGAGDWTHQYGVPDNSACNYDERVGGKLKVQWWGRPGPRAMADRGPRNPAPVSANGRLFVQGLRVLFGIDAYNGTILWSKQMPTMRRANMPRGGSNMVATDDILYVALQSQCAGFDAQTGKLVLKADLPASADDGLEWGYLAASGDKLVGSTTRKGGNYLGDGGQWFEDFKKEETAKVVSDGLFVLDRKTGKKRWSRQQGVVINSTITVSKGVVYFVESRNPAAKKSRQGRLQNEIRTEQYIVALNLDSGSFLWDKKADFSNCEFTTYMSHHGDTLLVAGTDKSKNYHTYAFDTAGRKPLWEHHTKTRKTHHSGHLMHPVIIDDKVFLNKHTFSLRSGEVLKVDPFDYHGCGTMSASARAIFHRFEYHGMLDLETGKRTEFTGVRGNCWLGQIPAGGLLLAPESGAGCSCTHAIQTSMAFVPEDD
ncbi:MAG: PQQ-binding-like beta-propeller repeat protein, partial [Planctomycetota bacterium]|nr:PQQ-binding-like beta-propeller repeat protein [Planctomycetota bacterium]